MQTPPMLSIVVPVYKEEKNVPIFLERTIAVLGTITKDFEIIFALDPSPDHTEEIILAARKNDNRIKLLTFSRRIGQPMATLAGMRYSQGAAVIVMDVDMQDPPELIAHMVEKWKEGNDVVLTRRKSREGETLMKRFVSYVGYKIINAIADVRIPPNTGDFRLMSRRVVDEVNRLKEHHGFLRGLVAIVGFRQTVLDFDRPPRYAGRGNYNKFFGSIKIGLNGIVCFSSYFLTLSSKSGFVIAGGSILLGIVYAFMKIFGFPFPLGNPTIVILILFMGGIQLVSVGILGEYIARIYEEVKERPRFIIDRSFGFDEITK